jgi:hypothetical protein
MAEDGRGKASRRAGPDSAAAFFSQLYAPAYVADLRSGVAARPAGHKARWPPGHEPAPAVVLISRARDGESAAVANLLGGVGVRTVCVDADRLVEAEFLVDPARGAVRFDGRLFVPTVAWLRHFSPQAIHGGGGRVHDLFLRESWVTAAAEIIALAATGIRSPSHGALAQLGLAEGHGIAVPQTVLTTDPYQALGFLRGQKLVIKAAHRHFVEPTPGSLSWVFPAIVGRHEITPLRRPGPPVIVQEYVEHEAELRVYCVAGQIHGFQVVKNAPADIWLHSDRVLARNVELPPNVVRAAKVLAAAESLRYCAFDFLLRDGKPVFLEMDPVGDWRWFETKAGESSVTLAVARMLCDLHRANLPAAMSMSSRPRRGTFDLLAFLTASASEQRAPRRG